MKVKFFNQPYVLYWDDNPLWHSTIFYNAHTIGASTEWDAGIVHPPQAIIIATKANLREEYNFGRKFL